MKRESIKNGRQDLIYRTERLECEPDPYYTFEQARLRGEPAFFWMHPSAGRWMVGEGALPHHGFFDPRTIGMAAR